MSTLLALLLAAWVDFGWQGLGQGGVEYIVQVRPEQWESFRERGFTSEVPANLRGIRRIRIVVGQEALPNEGTVPAVAPPEAAVAAKPLLPASPNGPQDSQADGAHTVRYNQLTSGDQADPSAAGGASSSDSESQAQAATAGQTFWPLGTQVQLQLGLGIAVLALGFLAWTHIGLRARYRNLLRKAHVRSALMNGG